MNQETGDPANYTISTGSCPGSSLPGSCLCSTCPSSFRNYSFQKFIEEKGLGLANNINNLDQSKKSNSSKNNQVESLTLEKNQSPIIRIKNTKKPANILLVGSGEITEDEYERPVDQNTSRSSSLSMKKPPSVIALPDVPSASLPVLADENKEGTKSLLSSDSNSSIKQSFEQQIEKELEIHLDSINSFKVRFYRFIESLTF